MTVVAYPTSSIRRDDNWSGVVGVLFDEEETESNSSYGVSFFRF